MKNKLILNKIKGQHYKYAPEDILGIKISEEEYLALSTQDGMTKRVPSIPEIDEEYSNIRDFEKNRVIRYMTKRLGLKTGYCGRLKTLFVHGVDPLDENQGNDLRFLIDNSPFHIICD